MSSTKLWTPGSAAGGAEISFAALARRQCPRTVHAGSAGGVPLDHPNICTIFEIDESDEGEMFIAMAFYDGATLEHTIREGPLDVERAVGITIQIARGLAAADEELIIHRDIKPGKHHGHEPGDGKDPGLGLAKLASRAGLTRPNPRSELPGDMSPANRSEARPSMIGPISGLSASFSMRCSPGTSFPWRARRVADSLHPQR